MNGTQDCLTLLPAGRDRAGADVALDDRRCSRRYEEALRAVLRAENSRELIRCTTDNLGEGGLRCTIPTGISLGVGERYEIVIESAPKGSKLSHLTGETCYATVCRTEASATREDMLGVGLRFDFPLPI
jgi:hypothetical protein